jgi:hypothetical protein
METSQVQPIKDDVDFKELSELIKVTNSVPLAIAIFMMIFFYRNLHKFADCSCKETNRKLEDKAIYLELKTKDLQHQIDDLSIQCKNKRNLSDK